MSTRQARTKPRTRRSMEILAEQSEDMHHAELWTQVREELPPDAEDAETYDNGQEKAENAWRWQTSDLVMAGWLHKNNGLWRITSLGRSALGEHPDPASFYEAGQAALSYWKRHKPGFAYAARLVRAIPRGRWLSLDDLSAATGCDRGPLSRWLWGVRPPGAHRVLGSDGLPPPEVLPDDREANAVLRAVAAEQGRADAAAAREDHRIGVAGLQPHLASEEPAGPRTASAWLLRGGGEAGRNMVTQWRETGFCSLAASRLGPVEPPVTKEELRLRVEDRYAYLSYNKRGELAAEFDLFLNRMREDDLVCATNGGFLFLGRVAGDPEWTSAPDQHAVLRRAVEWSDLAVAHEELPQELRGRLQSQHDVVDLTGSISLVRELTGTGRAAAAGREVPEDESTLLSQSTPSAASRSGAELPVPSASLASKLLVDGEWLREVRDLLQDCRQLIFYGPPGTGKTYLAQHIAEHLAGDPRAVKLVQFHPSYAYEDFFEGIRPVVQDKEGAGPLSFALRPGPFRQLVDLADEDPDTPYFLIIDEINRANLAKVFGELYFLLEYRDSTIDLPYSGEFRLPRNVFLIGTMNTADRSIALVDAAMRRRFAFMTLHPDQEPARDLLTRWIERKEGAGEISPGEDVPALHRALNQLIEDKDFRIGPSYLMRPSVYEEGGLERVWRSAILPLLEEHHYGDDLVDVEARYGLTALRGAVGQATPAGNGLAP
ncbi:AAA family ATPase [Streptomyces sp. BBFR102]|uniref:AAA family ATPase n=1 Tax=Streptomyces sp. BBFR102 TaxID=3448171 RepID=UPI003F5317C6